MTEKPEEEKESPAALLDRLARNDPLMKKLHEKRAAKQSDENYLKEKNENCT